MKMEIAVSVCDEEGRLIAFQRMGRAFSQPLRNGNVGFPLVPSVQPGGALFPR
jgi:hypothetical protein